MTLTVAAPPWQFVLRLANSNTDSVLVFFDLIIRLPLRMATSSGDAAAAVNDVANANADSIRQGR